MIPHDSKSDFIILCIYKNASMLKKIVVRTFESFQSMVWSLSTLQCSQIKDGKDPCHNLIVIQTGLQLIFPIPCPYQHVFLKDFSVFLRYLDNAQQILCSKAQLLNYLLVNSRDFWHQPHPCFNEKQKNCLK